MRDWLIFTACLLTACAVITVTVIGMIILIDLLEDWRDRRNKR